MDGPPRAGGVWATAAVQVEGGGGFGRGSQAICGGVLGEGLKPFAWEWDSATPLKNGIGGGGVTPGIPFIVLFIPFMGKTREMESGDPLPPPLKVGGDNGI